MGKIEMDLRKAMNQADELEKIAENLRLVANNRMSNTLDSIAHNWESDNSRLFCNKGYIVMNNLEKTARRLKSLANSMRIIARNTYEAEKRAEEIARTRMYKD